MHRLEQVPGGAHAHAVSRTIARQKFGDDGGAFLALVRTLTYRQAADGEPIERHLRDRARAVRTQIRIARALYDTEQRLRRIAARGETAQRPAVRQLHRPLRNTA